MICHKKTEIKNVPFMEIVLLASMRIQIGFGQGQSINGINFEIIYRCCGKDMLKYSDDDHSDVTTTAIICVTNWPGLP